MSKTKAKTIVAKYVGNGGYLYGIPKKDLTDDDWQLLDEEQKELVKASPVYEMVAGSKATKDGE